MEGETAFRIVAEPGGNATRFSSGGGVNNWLRSLPLANPAESSRRILSALEETANARLGASARFRFLERLSPVFRDVVEGMESSLYREGFPLSDDAAGQVASVLRLRARVVANYRAVLGDDDLRPIRVSRLGKRRQLTAALRVVQHLGWLMEFYRRLEEKPPQAAWRAFFRAYRVGRKIGRGAAGNSLEQAFRLHLALALLRPGDFPGTEFRRVKQAVHCLLSGAVSPDPARHGDRTFFIDLAAGAPPSVLSIVNESARHAEHRYVLELSGAVNRLKQALFVEHGAELNIEGSKISRYSGRKLIEQWRVVDQARRMRRIDNAPVRVTKGVSSIALAGMDRVEGCPADDSQVVLDAARQWVSSFRAEVGVCSEPGRLRNRSESGFCIALPELKSRYRVGDVVAVQREGGMELAQVRWTGPDAKAKEFRLGLKRLGSRIRARQLKVGRLDMTSQPVPVLLFEHHKGFPALLFDNLGAHRHETVAVHNGARVVSLGVERLQEMTAAFECFRLDAAEVEDLQREAPESENDRDTAVQLRDPEEEDVWARYGFR